MKRLIFLIVIALMLLLPGNVFAAGTVTQAVTDVWSYDFEGDKIGFRTLVFTCVGAASGGAISDTASSADNTDLIQGWYLVKVLIVPGATNPTANSDVYIKDENSIDLLGAGGENLLDATGAQEIYPLLATKGGSPPIVGALTLDVDNQSVNSATYVITLIFSKYPMGVNGLT